MSAQTELPRATRSPLLDYMDPVLFPTSTLPGAIYQAAQSSLELRICLDTCLHQNMTGLESTQRALLAMTQCMQAIKEAYSAHLRAFPVVYRMSDEQAERVGMRPVE